MLRVAAFDPVFGTFVLALAVLAGGIYLSHLGVHAQSDDARKYIFSVVGVLFGLLAAGGLGTLLAKQAADTSANQASRQAATQAADKAADQAANQVKDQVTDAINNQAP